MDSIRTAYQHSDESIVARGTDTNGRTVKVTEPMDYASNLHAHHRRAALAASRALGWLDSECWPGAATRNPFTRNWTRVTR